MLSIFNKMSKDLKSRCKMQHIKSERATCHTSCNSGGIDQKTLYEMTKQCISNGPFFFFFFFVNLCSSLILEDYGWKKKPKNKNKNKNSEPDLHNGIKAIINCPCLDQQNTIDMYKTFFLSFLFPLLF